MSFGQLTAGLFVISEYNVRVQAA